MAIPLAIPAGIKIGATALSVLPGLLGGIFGKSEHNKYAELLMQQKLTMPEGISEAESIFGKKAQEGLIGKDLIGASIDENLSNTIRTAKTVADSPSALIEALIQGSTSAAEQKRKLGVEDATVRSGNEAMFANFLANVKAPAEARLEEFEINKILSAQAEKMKGTSALFGGIASGIGTGLSTYGNLEQLDFLKTKSETLKNFWN